MDVSALCFKHFRSTLFFVGVFLVLFNLNVHKLPEVVRCSVILKELQRTITKGTEPAGGVNIALE